MLILALDTSTDQASVAIADGRRIRAELTWLAAGNHSHHLTGAIQEGLRLAGVEVADLEGLAVAIGPGSFSGLRVGLAEAKGLALARVLPLVGIGTLDVTAHGARYAGGPILAVVPAGRGRFYAAPYGSADGRWQRTGDYRQVTAAGAAMLAPDHLVVGEGADSIAQLNPALTIGPTLRRAGYLAELGSKRLADGEIDDLNAIEPLYLRRSAAEETRAQTRGEEA